MNIPHRLIGVALGLGVAVLGPRVLAQDKGLSDDRKIVCPIYKAAQFEDYCTYYSLECPSKPVAYNDQNCFLPSGNCMTFVNCLTLRRGPGAFNSDDVLLDGLSRRYPPAVEPQREPGVDVVERSKVQFRDSANKWIKAKLFLLKASRKEPAAYFGVGVEIVSANDFPEVRPVEFNGQVCYLKMGDVTYTVVLHTRQREAAKNQTPPTVPPQAPPQAPPKGPLPKALPKGPPQDQAGREASPRKSPVFVLDNLPTAPSWAVAAIKPRS